VNPELFIKCILVAQTSRWALLHAFMRGMGAMLRKPCGTIFPAQQPA
jgi:hypothetical protein